MQSYDPLLRRNTPLARKLKQLIGERGPLPISRFMSFCLHDSEHGYYVHRDAIGRGGDFITAPEISQVFGEIIGLWCAVVWQQMGKPDPVILTELGPGRGTMMRDMLRAIASVPEFAGSVRVTLSEPSPRLRAIQMETLAGARIAVTHVEPGETPKEATIMVANEVMDCVPIDQIVRVAGPDGALEWRVRTVETGADGELQFGLGRAVSPGPKWDIPGARLGDIIENNRTRLKFEAMGRELAAKPLAALFVDYGYTQHGPGDTLQAVRGHAFEHPLTSPGEADLTAQVSFAQVADGVAQAKLALDGPITQAELLGRLGIVERASRLMAANPARGGEIEAGVARLLAPNGMGTRFKAIGVRSPGMPVLPGFA